MWNASWRIAYGRNLTELGRTCFKSQIEAFHVADDVYALLYSCVSLIYIYYQNRKFSRHFDLPEKQFYKLPNVKPVHFTNKGVILSVGNLT
jgi:hypothetical protein